ncbi:MAG: tRNA (cytidine(56)-2'-O)-methyltransferase [Methanomicrobiales archaeon]|nr:tRNA (cytidine(56)-2'-O)-methyltransferase [Methanomicrobiales archaeon]
MQLPEVVVLRLGHRPERDQRVTTHVGLAARAFGANGMLLAEKDTGVVQSLRDVVERWGGDFTIQDGVSWRQCIREWKASGGTVVHLTMYGLKLTDAVEELRGKQRILLVAGAEKVPGEVYGLADYNISVSTQPHSEVSGVAVFLDRLFLGETMDREYPGAPMRIVPSRAGKRTVP